jgi:hypothetical protein
MVVLGSDKKPDYVILTSCLAFLHNIALHRLSGKSVQSTLQVLAQQPACVPHGFGIQKHQVSYLHAQPLEAEPCPSKEDAKGATRGNASCDTKQCKVTADLLQGLALLITAQLELKVTSISEHVQSSTPSGPLHREDHWEPPRVYSLLRGINPAQTAVDSPIASGAVAVIAVTSPGGSSIPLCEQSYVLELYATSCRCRSSNAALVCSSKPL